MKYIKENVFQNRENDIIDSKTLLSQIIALIIGLGYDHRNYYDRGDYETEFTNDTNSLFFVTVSPALKNIKIRYLSTDIDAEHIVDYFKTLKGLTYYNSNHQCTFHIDDNINDITKQISKKDFELKQTANKYNL
jgi:hypothetical protein